ncbi:MAG: hypothetical protein JWM33_470 [Caulobacteraceae bacterium]|nr:hypothetical protein [Caulobacteraceae bacterium]
MNPLDIIFKNGPGVTSEERSDPHLIEYIGFCRRLAKRDYDALDGIEKLSEKSSIMSLLLIADFMRLGWAYNKDLDEAERRYEVAAKAGSLRGLWGLGRTHFAKNKIQVALDELNHCLDRGYPPAMNTLATIYFHGDGVISDKLYAYKLWCQGAARGHYYSRCNLISRYIYFQYGSAKAIHALSFLLPLGYQFLSRINNVKYKYQEF